MKYIYFGSSQFSKAVLEGLIQEKHTPLLIVSRPDKPKGRGLHLFSTEVSSFAGDKKIPLFKPQSLREKGVKEVLAGVRADFFVVADYGEIIPSRLLEIPKKYSLCVHPSLLPLYRGPAPIESTLMNGRIQTGVTIFKVSEKVDAGDIILQRKVIIGCSDDFFSLSQKLAKKGAALLIEAIDKIISGNCRFKPQNETKATFTFKLKKEDGRILWSRPAEQIRDLVRATLGWPSAYTYYKDVMVKVLAAEAINEENSNKPGTIVSVDKEGIDVVTADGSLKIKKLKPQGKKEMDAWSFVCGHRIQAGDKFL